MQKTLLRSALLFIIFNCSFIITKAQWVTIPDAAFVTFLQATFPACMNGNLMDTTCSGIVTTTAINCSHRPIINLNGIQYFDNLDTLSCYYDSLTTLPALPGGLTFFDCSYNKIPTLPALPSGLTELYCGYNQLTNLPTLPSSLTTLYCYNNQLTNFPALPSSLTLLFCSYNQVTSLPTLPTGLTYLYCHNNQLTSLPALPSSLTELFCAYNQVTSLPALPSSLTELDCYDNQLTGLPTLPTGLTNLDCGKNPLTSLPALPSSLASLDCRITNLTSLPVLPSGLTDITCDNSPLTSLPALPGGLQSLACGGTQITSLPALPSGLTKLFCYYNHLTSLPELPDSLATFYCDNNPNLFCLPQLKKVRTFHFSNTGITCLPNYPLSNTSSNPPLNSISLCDLANVHSCLAYWNIAGTVYIDGNANCNRDGAENGFTGAKVQLYQNGVLQQQVYSSSSGGFSFDTDLSDYIFSIDTGNLPLYLACPDTGYHTASVTALDSFITGKDFGLRCKPGFDVGVQSIYGSRFRPASLRQVDIHAGDVSNFYGANCAVGIGGTVTVTINGSAHYVAPASGALTPSNVSGNVLTYTIADFGTTNLSSSFNIKVQTDTTAVLGSLICFTVSVTPTAGDNNPANNTLSQCFTVVGSFDPNEKIAYPAEDIDTTQKWLTYTVNFQNTGTAEAELIRITDTLGSYIDEGSFQLLAYSFKPIVHLKGSYIEFAFPNINLIDSFHNEPLSHGYVQYKVKLKDNLPIGTTINNTAFIYFDFNAPVVTNTTNNTITTTTGISTFSNQHSSFSIYPNPATESVRISVDESMIGSNLTITDITGRRVAAVRVLNSAFSIPTSAFASGVYFVTLETKAGRVTKKLVKQ